MHRAGEWREEPRQSLGWENLRIQILLYQLLPLAAPCRGSALLISPHLVELFAVAASQRFGSSPQQIAEIPSDTLGEQRLVTVLSLPGVSSLHGLLFIGEAVPKIASFLALS